MVFSGALVTVVLSLASTINAHPHVPHQHIRRAVDIDTYIASQTPASKQGILNNIGPSGAKSSGAFPGVVIASPSTVNPNYLYTWIRDSALTYKLLVDQYTQGQDSTLEDGIEAWISSMGAIQQITNPSGSVSTGGLGEPKFYINQTAFMGPWGRPQRDGPGLRAISMITYSNYLLANGSSQNVTAIYWPIIQLDLDYVAENWQQPTFDLWEEVNGNSFFTTAAQHRALREGASFAQQMGDSARASSYTTQADNVLCFLQNYWSTSSSYIISNLNTNDGRSGLDANSLLGSIHSFDPAAACDATTFQPCSDKALANHLAVVNSFRGLYPLNNGIAANDGVAVGRYKEDVYFNGNPWYLCTFAAAEQLYDALYTWNKFGSVNVTTISQPFFQQFLPSAAPGTYASGSSEFSAIVSGIQNMADGFVEMNAQYTPSNGGLSEQYDKSSGVPTSAADLTWSYASSLTAFARRSGVVPASWGALNTADSSCATVAVTFNVNAITVPGENIYLTGNVAALSDWSTTNAIAMSATGYPDWSVTVNLPPSTTIQYKYFRMQNSQVTWESDPNNSINTPSQGSESTSDSWR